MKTLNLTLKKKWFDMIASGEKKEEYREIKPYWLNRFFYYNENFFKGYNRRKDCAPTQDVSLIGSCATCQYFKSSGITIAGPTYCSFGKGDPDNKGGRYVLDGEEEICRASGAKCNNGNYSFNPKAFDLVSANNGYAKDCPNIKWEHKGIRIGTGRAEWGAEPGKQYFILDIGSIIPASGIEAKSPQRSEDLERIARPDAIIINF